MCVLANLFPFRRWNLWWPTSIILMIVEAPVQLALFSVATTQICSVSIALADLHIASM